MVCTKYGDERKHIIYNVWEKKIVEWGPFSSGHQAPNAKTFKTSKTS
jgi:hypothetical protein